MLSSVPQSGCVDDPTDPKTWIKKLGDPREGKEALSQLVKLKNPAAVPPLLELYKKNKDLEVLKAIGSFKDKAAVPVLIEALDYSEENYEQAATAATALGEIDDNSSAVPLSVTLAKPLSIKTRANVVKLEAMKALVKIHKKSPPAKADADKVVDALIKLLETSADDQDFALNQVSATTLAEYADPRSAPALIRGLFMTGRGTDIFQPCRIALLNIGQAGVKAIIEAHQRKFAKLEADAKKYEFSDLGKIEQKTALILGDLRAKEAVPVLLGELKKPKKGDNHTGALYALGMIADKATTKDIVAVLTDGKRDYQVRTSAAEALNLAQDTSALPALLNVAKTGDVVKEGQKYADVRLAAGMAYSRLGGAAEADAFAPVYAAEKAKAEGAKEQFAEYAMRLEVAKKCNRDSACYITALDDKDLAKQEKAAFMLGTFDKSVLPALTKKVSSKEPVVRIAVLFSIGKLADKTATDVKKAIEAQIELDRTKPQPFRLLVEEMRATLAMIGGK